MTVAGGLLYMVISELLNVLRMASRTLQADSIELSVVVQVGLVELQSDSASTHTPIYTQFVKHC